MRERVQGIFLDIETNGLDFYSHCALEIGLRIIDLNSGSEISSYHSLIKPSPQSWRCSNAKSLEINGFHSLSNFDQAPEACAVGEEIKDLFQRSSIGRQGSVFICQNPSFDRPFFTQLVPSSIQESLNWPYHWLDLASMYWTRVLAREKHLTSLDITKDSIAQHLGIEPEKAPHRALQGVDHLIACYEKLLGWH